MIWDHAESYGNILEVAETDVKRGKKGNMPVGMVCCTHPPKNMRYSALQTAHNLGTGTCSGIRHLSNVQQHVPRGREAVERGK